MHQSAATLGFYGDDLDPEELTAGLGSLPTVGVRKGGIWHTSLGAPPARGASGPSVARPAIWTVRFG
ncbi:hypothetical protein, partial [Klebsiella pneumoniae]|uniref:hypothetical protein n=1 Tax=Klebsiella pneumoniae TaxID=573 RepID=UPI001953A987